MKDTGIPWVGSIPQNWKLGRVKQGFFRKKAEAHEENPVVLSLARAGVKVRDISNNEGQLAESYYNYNPVVPGDLLLNPMDLYSGANCSISKVSGVISPAYINLGAKEGFNPSYYDYYFKTQYWAMAMFAHGKGVSFDNRWTLNANDLLNYYIPIPDKCEQDRIATCLDNECKRIDNIITKTQESIEEYKKLKQSIITQAVTKGVRGNREMKDSGIELVGEIPIEWDIRKIKSLSERVVVGVVIRPSEYFDEDGTVPFLRGMNVKEYEIIDNEFVYISEQNNQILSKSIVKAGDILVVRDGSIGTACVVPRKYDGANVVSMIIVTPDSDNNSDYMCFVFNSSIGKEQFNVTKIGSALTHTSVDAVSNILSPVPSLNEQNEIVKYLKDKCRHIDKIINDKVEFLTELELYKKSLIYECVTGKKEVM